jgi:hypothetical protein
MQPPLHPNSGSDVLEYAEALHHYVETDRSVPLNSLAPAVWMFLETKRSHRIELNGLEKLRPHGLIAKFKRSEESPKARGASANSQKYARGASSCAPRSRPSMAIQRFPWPYWRQSLEEWRAKRELRRTLSHSSYLVRSKLPRSRTPLAVHAGDRIGRLVPGYLWFAKLAPSKAIPFQAICTPMHIRMKAITRKIPCTVEGETALISFGA